METMQMHKSALPPNLVSKGLQESDDELIKSLEEIVAYALKKNKTERYQTVADMKDDLESALKQCGQIQTNSIREQTHKKNLHSFQQCH